MAQNLPQIRTQIDELDECIVRSLFDRFHCAGNPRETKMTPEEVKRIQSTGFHVSQMTWQLINARMELSSEVGEIKKETGGNNIVDEERKKIVIKNAKSHAPVSVSHQIENLYEIIHEISVRIQNAIMLP